MKSILFYFWLLLTNTPSFSLHFHLADLQQDVLVNVFCEVYSLSPCSRLVIYKEKSFFVSFFFVSVYRDYNRAKTTWPRHMARKQLKMSANATQPLLGEWMSHYVFTCSPWELCEVICWRVPPPKRVFTVLGKLDYNVCMLHNVKTATSSQCVHSHFFHIAPLSLLWSW